MTERQCYGTIIISHKIRTIQLNDYQDNDCLINYQSKFGVLNYKLFLTLKSNRKMFVVLLFNRTFFGFSYF